MGNIYSYETSGLVDGPGIRFVVFLSGCKLRCTFCHNPETWNMNSEIKATPEEVISKIIKYKNYFKENGGVTFSGGEPLLQPEFLINCLKLCKENNIHTCLDTSGIGIGKYEEILSLTDVVLLDIKALTPTDYKQITGSDIDEFTNFLTALKDMGNKVWIRQVIIPTINDNEKYIYKLKDFLKNIPNIEKIELLPYHTLGVSKYEKLNIPYPLKGISNMDINKLKEFQKIVNL